MILINPQGEYPRFIGDLQLENPNWVVGDSLPEGWSEVTPTLVPAVSEDETVDEGAPELTEAGYVQTWVVRNMTDEEKQFRTLQAIRQKVAFGVALTAEEAAFLTA